MLLLFIGTSLLSLFLMLRIRQARRYRTLKTGQRTLLALHHNAFQFDPPDELPSFARKIVSIPNFLPHSTFVMLHNAVVTQTQTERSYLPLHKKGGTISYEELHKAAPLVVAFYHSPALSHICSRIIGENVYPTPIHDQSSCSLLFYDRPQDHIGWHYDYNFYHGRHFTVLFPVVNKHYGEEHLSSAQLIVKAHGQDQVIPTPPNTFILFEGAYVYHRVTKLQQNEIRILLSMTFCTDPQSSPLQGLERRIKDIAYFGVRALWT